ncbi:MAG: GNAT family N-acetyltransferase [Rhodobiaceae bacterium]|nr:GNAT family N-acetyltransferase [Rhodobiaceae bacterium]
MVPVATGPIRTATIGDAADIAAIHVQSWRETYDGLVPPAMLARLDVDQRTRFWTHHLTDIEDGGPAAVFVAMRDGAAAGFVAVCGQRTDTLAERGFDGEIAALYVLRSAQRHGLGRALFARATDHLRQHGFAAASLWVLTTNTPARAFYEAMGGRVMAEREDVREDAVLAEVAYGWDSLTG